MHLHSPGIRRIRAALLCGAVALGLPGCGAGGGDVQGEPDAMLPMGQDCHPVLGPDCSDGLRCAFILEDPVSGEGRTACTSPGTVPMGESCTPPQLTGESDDCAAGHCYNGRCHAMCMADTDTCGGETFCVTFEGLEFDLCLLSCDPLAQDCADTDSGAPQGCYLIDGGSVCAAVASGSGDGRAPGEPCVYQNECKPMSGCFDDGEGGGVCLHYCDYATFGAAGQYGDPVTDPDNCAPSEVCGPIFGEDLVGVCVEP